MPPRYADRMGRKSQADLGGTNGIPEWAERAIFRHDENAPLDLYELFLGEIPMSVWGIPYDEEIENLGGGDAIDEYEMETITPAEALGIEFDESDPWCRDNRDWLLPEGSVALRTERPAPPDLVLRPASVVRRELGDRTL